MLKEEAVIERELRHIARPLGLLFIGSGVYIDSQL